MLTRITNSIYSKQVAVVLSLAIMLMSFKARPDGEVVLNAGTNVVLETVSMIRSDQVRPGQMIDFRVKYDVKVDGKVVIVGGSMAKGQVMRAQQAKGLGKEGFVEIQVSSVKAVDGQDVFLSGTNVFQEGEEKQTLSIVLGIFVCILFLLMKGKNAEIPPGFQISAGVATTMTINVP